MTGPSTQQRLIALAQNLVAMREPEMAEAVASVLADLTQAERERDEARDALRNAREFKDALEDELIMALTYEWRRGKDGGVQPRIAKQRLRDLLVPPALDGAGS